MGYFVAEDWPYQPAEWQIHEFYLLTDNKSQFHATIQTPFKLMYLIKKYYFSGRKIKEIVIPKNELLFIECCFQSDSKIAAACERLDCRGKYKFDDRSHKKRNSDVERSYCLDRKSLKEYWHCVLFENHMICPEWCKECGSCKELEDVRDELKRAYFFNAKTDSLHQLVFQSVHFKNEHINPTFRIDIKKAKENKQMIE